MFFLAGHFERREIFLGRIKVRDVLSSFSTIVAMVALERPELWDFSQYFTVALEEAVENDPLLIQNWLNSSCGSLNPQPTSCGGVYLKNFIYILSKNLW